jgi:hypothetical protein
LAVGAVGRPSRWFARSTSPPVDDANAKVLDNPREPLTDGPEHVNLLDSMFERLSKGGEDASQRLIGPGMRCLCAI